MRKHLIWTALLLSTLSLFAQDNYSTYSGLIDRIARVGKRTNVQLTSLGLTPAARNIWCLRIGGEEREQVPGIAIIAGADGYGLMGTELSMRMAEKLSEDDTLLEKVSFYVIPLANPDVYANDPTKVRYLKHTNSQPIDDDKDGFQDEDPAEDLNDDRLITMMRIEDVTGSWRVHPEDPRVMVKANLGEGEKGHYRLLVEGFDNDKDGKLNEDGVGGVNLNRNLPFNYPAFTEGAGAYAASSIESRALLDMLYEQWNIHTVLVFGQENNLSHPWKAREPRKETRVISNLLPEDQEAFDWVVDIYQNQVPGKDAPQSAASGGDLLSWAYFHYGRYSFASPGWWVPRLEPDSGEVKDMNNETIRFLHWAEKTGQGDLWVNWQEIEHPDFPDQKVEVGGMVPYANMLPPFEMVDSIAANHLSFLTELAYMLPRLELQNLKVESLSNEMTRITVDLYNAGALPTHSAMGQKIRWVRKPKVELILNPDEDQQIVAGRPVEILGPIPGDGSVKLSWLVRGNGSLVLKGGSPVSGFVQEVIELK
jgi:hypothetical protein